MKKIPGGNPGNNHRKYAALAAAALALNGPLAADTVEDDMASEVTSADSASGPGRVQLDLRARTTGSFAGCLEPALHAAGVDWSLEHLRGYLGPAFAFSMEPGGGHLHQAENYEWHHFYGMLDFLEHESISVALKGVIAVPPEEHDAAKARGWEMVRRALDDGYPAIVWQAMTVETKQSGRRPIPFLWSLITGYDEEAGTYSVHHGGAGHFTIGWDAFGHSDPVNWFCVMVFRPLTEPFDGATAGRQAVERALEASRGSVPASGRRPTVWPPGRCGSRPSATAQSMSTPSGAMPSSWSTPGRPRPSTCGTSSPTSRRPPARRCSRRPTATTGVAARISDLRVLCAAEDPDLQRAAEVLAAALEAERAALASLQEALEAG